MMTRGNRTPDDVSVQVLDIGQFLFQYQGSYNNRDELGGVEEAGDRRNVERDPSKSSFREQCRLVSTMWKVRYLLDSLAADSFKLSYCLCLLCFQI